MKPCFFCNQNGSRPPPGAPVYPPQYPSGGAYPQYPGGGAYPQYPGGGASYYPQPIKPAPVDCIHCNSTGYKQFAGRMDPCFFCNKSGHRPPTYNAVHCIHCSSTGWKN